MFTKNIKDSFTANLLSAVSGVLGEAKKCKECGCAKCECDDAEDAEETQEGYMPTNDMPSAKDRATAGKLGALLKRERSTKEKKEPIGVKTEEVEDIEEKRGLWDNIHAKRERIKHGSGERMRKPGSEGAPSAADLKASQTEAMDPGLEDELMSQRQGESGKKWRVERHGKTISTHSSKDAADVKAMKHPSNKVVAKESIDDSFEQIDEISKSTLGRYINKAKDSIDTASYRQGHKEAHGSSSRPLEKKLSKRHKGIETAVKKLTKEEAEQIDEISKATLGSYIKKASGAEQPKNVMSPKNVPLTKIAAYQGDSETGHFGKRFNQHTYDKAERLRKNRETGIKTAVNKLTKEESEQIDELSREAIASYAVQAADDLPTQARKTGPSKVKNRIKGINMAVSRLHGEEVESIDELSKDTMGRYIKKAATKIGTQGVTAGLKIAKDERSQKNFDTIGKRERGIATAVKKLTKEEQDFVDALNDADMEQIDELSKDAMLNYLHANKHKNTKDGNPRRDLVKSMRGTDMAVRKYTAKPGSKSVRVPATEEVELDEARGRPRKAGARDFTIHPKTKEKLMHDNPEHMKRIEALQKTGMLQKPKTEAGQHVINQLSKAKTSMRGGETINFTHGEPTHVSGTHAAKLLDKYAGMKPDEKEAFQKKISHSHAKLKSEL